MPPSPAPRFSRLVPAAVLAGTLAAAAATFTVQALNPPRPAPAPASAPASAPAISTSTSLPPCASDDGSGPRPCVWVATARGHRGGRSFVILTDGALIYLDHAPACISHELESGS
jgi:hypothetical protein